MHQYSSIVFFNSLYQDISESANSGNSAEALQESQKKIQAGIRRRKELINMDEAVELSMKNMPKGRGYLDSDLRAQRKAIREELGNIADTRWKEQAKITEKARQYSSSPINQASRNTGRPVPVRKSSSGLTYYDKINIQRLRNNIKESKGLPTSPTIFDTVEEAVTSAPKTIKPRRINRKLAIGAGVAGLAGLGLGAYALSRRNNQQEQR